jgi:hypothetical protein
MRRGITSWRRLLSAVALAAAVSITPEARAIVGSNSGTPAGNIFNGVYINDLIGAGTFYGLGFGGSRAVVANVEAGAIWNGHETLTGRVSQYVKDPAVLGTQLGQFDWHATMVGQAIGGTGLYTYQEGIAPTAQLWSGSIATAWIPEAGSDSTGSFDITEQSFLYPYVTTMRTGISGSGGTLKANVLNSSWGYPDSPGQFAETIAIDALALENNVIAVMAAGNEGPTANTVGGPASGYNSISVAGLTGDTLEPPFSTVASFSSRGPGDFFNPATNTTIPNVRPTVDIAAPGDDMTLAFYGGVTGGHTSGADPTGGVGAYYVPNMGGTSFAAPVTAGAAALMVDAGKLFVDSGVASSEMLDARVIKAALLAGSKPPAGWSNGQATVGGVITTTQALDQASGAGILDLNSAYRIYVGDPTSVTVNGTPYVFAGQNTTLGLPGDDGGSGIAPRGWDLGSVFSDSTAGSGRINSYSFASPLTAGDTFTACLSWFADRTLGTTLASATDVALSNLSLEVWRSTGSGESLVARSAATYSTTEFLRFTVPQDGAYSLHVVGLDQLYNLGLSPTTATAYGLAWQVVPEPNLPCAALIVACGAWVVRRRTRRTRAA